jgi:hypothetical protein
VVQALEILQQGHQCHRILAAGYGHQQPPALGQQGWLAQQVAVQPKVQGTPAGGLPGGGDLGRRCFGWENRFQYPKVCDVPS